MKSDSFSVCRQGQDGALSRVSGPFPASTAAERWPAEKGLCIVRHGAKDEVTHSGTGLRWQAVGVVDNTAPKYFAGTENPPFGPIVKAAGPFLSEAAAMRWSGGEGGCLYREDGSGRQEVTHRWRGGAWTPASPGNSPVVVPGAKPQAAGERPRG